MAVVPEPASQLNLPWSEYDVPNLNLKLRIRQNAPWSTSMVVVIKYVLLPPSSQTPDTATESIADCNAAVSSVDPSPTAPKAAGEVTRCTSPEVTEKSAESKEATPLLDDEASSPAIVTVVPVAEVSIPSPPAMVIVSESRSISIVPLSVETSRS